MQNTFCESSAVMFVTYRHKCLNENFGNISVIISKKNMILIPLLVFQLVQALGTAKGFVNFTKFSRSSEF